MPACLKTELKHIIGLHTSELAQPALGAAVGAPMLTDPARVLSSCLLLQAESPAGAAAFVETAAANPKRSQLTALLLALHVNWL